MPFDIATAVHYAPNFCLWEWRNHWWQNRQISKIFSQNYLLKYDVCVRRTRLLVHISMRNGCIWWLTTSPPLIITFLIMLNNLLYSKYLKSTMNEWQTKRRCHGRWHWRLCEIVKTLKLHTQNIASTHYKDNFWQTKTVNTGEHGATVALAINDEEQRIKPIIIVIIKITLKAYSSWYWNPERPWEISFTVKLKQK